MTDRTAITEPRRNGPAAQTWDGSPTRRQLNDRADGQEVGRIASDRSSVILPTSGGGGDGGGGRGGGGGGDGTVREVGWDQPPR